jgi:acetyl esterase/lipase
MAIVCTHAFRGLLAAVLLGSAGLVAHAADDAAPVLPPFAVKDRIDPSDPMAERPILWDRPSVTLQDVVYSTVPGYRPLRLDLYRPVGKAKPLPLIVFVHGGGWSQANPRVGAAFADFPAVLGSLAERGYVVASIGYRLSGEAAFPAQLDDLRAALSFLRTHAERLGIEPARIGLWGMSAGAHLAALQVTGCGTDPCVQAFAGWFGVYDLAAHEATPGSASVRALLRCEPAGCSKESIAAASPLRQAGAGDPPTLLVHGSADRQVAPAHSQALASALVDAGVDAELLLLPAVGHGLIGADAAATASALQAALQETVGFFDRHLRTGLQPAATPAR